MIDLTPKKLIDYVSDFDYVIDEKQAMDIFNALDDYYGNYFTGTEIQMVTDYVVNGKKSIFLKQFE